VRIHINGMFGLGDNLYQLGFVRALADQGHHVTIVTPWPEIYADVPNIGFQRPHTNLRTQNKNIQRVESGTWNTDVNFDKRMTVHYGAGTVIPSDMQRIFDIQPTWGLRKFKQPKRKKPYIVIRPATARKEWLNEARNPLPEYIDQVARWLSKKYEIISVADLQDGQEWLVGDAPHADVQYHAGELSVSDLMALCQGASGIMGGIGWLVPYAINAGTPAFVIAGGNGGYNHPEKLINSTMNLDKIRFATPDEICMCIDNRHGCNKTISDLKDIFNEWKSLL